MDDDFIKEKLNMITKDDEILEVPAPESLKALSKEYAQKFAEKQKTNNSASLPCSRLFFCCGCGFSMRGVTLLYFFS